MRARIQNVLGLILAGLISLPTTALSQAGATQAAPEQGRRGGRGGQATPQPQSPTFAGIQARTYEFKDGSSPIQLPYELYVPSQYDKSKPTPLIVALHGLTIQPSQIIRYQGLTDLAEERNYIVVAPMGYNVRGWYGARGTGRTAGRGRRGGRGGDTSNDPENLGELSEKDVMNVFEMVRKEFNIDPSRTYLMGHSMGGGGTIYLGSKYKQYWAALAPYAPAVYLDIDATLAQLKDMPVFMVQGDADALVNVERVRPWAERMKSTGMNHIYIEVAGGDHMGVVTSSPETMRRMFDFFDKARKK
jgi:poly(3-hydroxybutyrate) depolymerase